MGGKLLLLVGFGDLDDHLFTEYVDCLDSGLLGLGGFFGLLLDIGNRLLL